MPPTKKRASTKRRQFPAEFKQKAVERVKSGEGIGAVAADIHANEGVLRYWIRHAPRASRHSVPARQPATKPDVRRVLDLEAANVSRLRMLGNGTRPTTLSDALARIERLERVLLNILLGSMGV